MRMKKRKKRKGETADNENLFIHAIISWQTVVEDFNWGISYPHLIFFILGRSTDIRLNHQSEEKNNEKIETKMPRDWEQRYRVILKKVSFGIFGTILVSKEEKILTTKSKDYIWAISEQVFMIFGHGQNHPN